MLATAINKVKSNYTNNNQTELASVEHFYYHMHLMWRLQKLRKNIYAISWFNPGQTMPQHLYNHSDNLILCTELTVSSLNRLQSRDEVLFIFLTILFIKKR